MSIPAGQADDANELVVSPELLEAAGRQGVRLHVGDRVRLEVIDGHSSTAKRALPWLGAVATGKGDLGTRTKDIVRDEMGDSAS